MAVEIKAWAYDILNAICEIESFISDIPDFISYQKDIKTKRAIERGLEIIGEALYRIEKKSSGLQFTDGRKIIDTRNRIIHGYDSVSDEIIWSIINYHLPTLKKEIKLILEK